MILILTNTVEILEKKEKECELLLPNDNIFSLCLKLIKFLALCYLTGNSKIYEVYSLSYSEKDSIKPNYKVGFIDRYRLNSKLLLNLIIETVKIVSYYRINYKYSIICPLIKGYYMYKFAEEMGINNFNMWGYSYTLEVTAMVNILNSKGVNVRIYETVNFVERLNYVNSNEIIHTSFIQSDYAQKLNNDYGKIYHKHFCSYEDLENIFIKSNTLAMQKLVVYFCSGANQRMKIGSIYNSSYLNQLWMTEILNIELLSHFAKNNLDHQVVIMPHYARSIETEISAFADYENLICSENMRVGKIKDINEIKHDANLSLSIKSNTFWDSLYSGKKAMLLNPFPLDNFLESLPMNRFILCSKIDDVEQVAGEILKNLQLTNLKFFKSKFVI
jgi:hypothetical protein